MKTVTKRIPASLYRKIHEAMPIICVDLVVKADRGPRRFLLVKRKNEPEAGAWWLIGGRLFKNESLRHAALRKLKEEAGLVGRAVRQLGVHEYFSRTGYFPGISAHCIAIVYLVETNARGKVRWDAQSTNARWFTRMPSGLAAYPKKFLRLAGFSR